MGRTGNGMGKTGNSINSKLLDALDMFLKSIYQNNFILHEKNWEHQNSKQSTFFDEAKNSMGRTGNGMGKASNGINSKLLDALDMFLKPTYRNNFILHEKNWKTSKFENLKHSAENQVGREGVLRTL